MRVYRRQPETRIRFYRPHGRPDIQDSALVLLSEIRRLGVSVKQGVVDGRVETLFPERHASSTKKSTNNLQKEKSPAISQVKIQQ
jgi:hypothetical protein